MDGWMEGMDGGTDGRMDGWTDGRTNERQLSGSWLCGYERMCAGVYVCMCACMNACMYVCIYVRINACTGQRSLPTRSGTLRLGYELFAQHVLRRCHLFALGAARPHMAMDNGHSDTCIVSSEHFSPFKFRNLKPLQQSSLW